MENTLKLQTAALRRETDAENIAAALRILNELQQLLAERNKRCKLLK
jgi:hypothetical protein